MDWIDIKKNPPSLDLDLIECKGDFKGRVLLTSFLDNWQPLSPVEGDSITHYRQVQKENL